MSDAKRRIVITGSTRGIGLGMAREFLLRGHSVVVSSRGRDSVDRAVASLEPIAAVHGGSVSGTACDVSSYEDVERLWAAAVQAFGRIDIWINNAGLVNRRKPVGELDPQDLRDVPRTNVLGVMNACQVALREMTRQGGGFIYNFEGLGSNGQVVPGMSVYGATKAAVGYFTKCLVKECAGGPVKVGYISPGIVITDLAMAASSEQPPETQQRLAKIYNILADTVDTVAPYLVQHVLANERHGARIVWLTRRKAMGRFLAAGFSKRDVVSTYRAGA